MAVSIFNRPYLLIFRFKKIIFQVWYLIDGLRMVIQKKMGVEDKEAYAWSFEVIWWFTIFLPTEVSNPVKWPPFKNYTIRIFNYSTVPWYKCSTLERLQAPLKTAQDQGGRNLNNFGI